MIATPLPPCRNIRHLHGTELLRRTPTADVHSFLGILGISRQPSVMEMGCGVSEKVLSKEPEGFQVLVCILTGAGVTVSR